MFTNRVKPINGNDPAPDPQPAPNPWYVPPELRPFYEAARGLTDTEKAQFLVDGGKRLYDLTLRTRGPRDEITEPEHITDVRVWEHRCKLEQADQARRTAEFQQVIRSNYRDCDLCGQSTMGGQLSEVEHGEQRLRLCGSCTPVAQAEIQRRRWSARLVELLGPTELLPHVEVTPATTEAHHG